MTMRKNNICRLLVVVILGFMALSCHELDLEPKGIFDEGTLFNSDYGIRTYPGHLQ